MTKRPHIYFARGFWRVSPMPMPYAIYTQLWAKAHKHVTHLNYARRAAQYRAKQK